MLSSLFIPNIPSSKSQSFSFLDPILKSPFHLRLASISRGVGRRDEGEYSCQVWTFLQVWPSARSLTFCWKFDPLRWQEWNVFLHLILCLSRKILFSNVRKKGHIEKRCYWRSMVNCRRCIISSDYSIIPPFCLILLIKPLSSYLTKPPSTYCQQLSLSPYRGWSISKHFLQNMVMLNMLSLLFNLVQAVCLS